MPINKNAYLRYRIIDELISTRNYQRLDLLDKLNERLELENGAAVSKETLDNDLKILRSHFKAPIQFNRSRGYHYEQKGYRVFTNELDKSEIRALDFAIDVLNGNSHIALIREAQTVLNKIFRKASQHQGERRVIISESNLDVQGVEFLEPLHTAILDKKCVIIEHRSLRQKKVVRHYFSPYALKEFKGLWYVVGYSAEKEMVINLALDRIKEVREPTGVSYHQDQEFNLSRYYRHSVGITTLPSGRPSKVTFWVSTESVYFINIQPLHGTQRMIEENEKGATFQMEVYLSEELLIALMGLGSRIKVLEPAALVSSIRDHVTKMKRHYKA